MGAYKTAGDRMSGSSGMPRGGPLQVLDARLQPVMQRLVVHFAVAKGVVQQRGSLEKSRRWHTDSRRGTLGKGWRSGWFGSYSLGSSDTTEITSRSISLLRIGSATLTDVEIASTAFYETLTQGSQVGCVLSHDRRAMFYVANASSGAELGHLPPWGLASSLRLWGVVLAGIVGIWAIASLVGGSASGVLPLVLAGLCALSARVGHLAVVRSREVFDSAVRLARQA